MAVFSGVDHVGALSQAYSHRLNLISGYGWETSSVRSGVSGCSNFTVYMPAAGRTSSVGAGGAQALVLVRVEVEMETHRQFQATVASPDAQVAPAVLRLLCLHLAGTPSA